MRNCIMAIDQGTTSSRVILFSEQGDTISAHSENFKQHFPQPGWVEHDASEIWQTVATCMQQALAKAKLQASELSCIGITNQRETTVIWDRQTGKPIHPAIVWQDRRTQTLCQQLHAQGHEAMIQQKTGLLLDPYFSASKIAWILDQDTSFRQLAAKNRLAFGTVESYLLWQLTQGKRHISDVSNAARSLLFNIHHQDWDKELLELFNIPRSLLPEVVANSGKIAQATIEGSQVAITGLAGDQQASLLGHGAIEAGDLKITYGTGAFLLLNTQEQIIASKHKLLTTIAYQVAQQTHYALEGSIFAAGTIVEWLRDQLNLVESSAETAKLAASLQDNNGVYCIPAFTGLGAPHWRPDVKAAFYGIERGTSKAHFVRAGLEAIAYQTLDLMQAMQQDTSSTIKALFVDGGMTKNDWLLQFLADITQVLVYRPKIIETTAFGAAFLAGLGAGIYRMSDIKKLNPIQQTFKPKLATNTAKQYYQGWQHYLARHLQ